MKFSQGSLGKLRKILKEDYDADLTDQELYESAFNLVGLSEVLLKCAHKDILSHLRLEKEPNGYQPEGDDETKCVLCGYYKPASDCWIDKYGLKCRLCQKAITDGIIPGSICRNKEAWFSMEGLKNKFEILPNTAKSLMRKGELKARVIINDAGEPHFTVFLREDNYKFLKIDKIASPSDMEEYDKQVAAWAEDYKKKLAGNQDSAK